MCVYSLSFIVKKCTLIQEQTSQWLHYRRTSHNKKSAKTRLIIQQHFGDVRLDKYDYSAMYTDGWKDDDIVVSSVFCAGEKLLRILSVFHPQLHFYCKGKIILFGN
jgi:hypothetical protein